MTDYSFSIRDNHSPIVLIWEDEINDPIFGDMPVVRKDFKDKELDYVAYLNELDIICTAERNMKWENAFTNTSMTWE